MHAEAMKKVVVDMTPEMMDFLKEFSIESAKSPKDFEIWYKALSNEKKVFLEAVCSAAALGLNDDLFDMTRFNEEAAKLREEKRMQEELDRTVYDFSHITLEGDESDKSTK